MLQLCEVLHILYDALGVYIVCCIIILIASTLADIKFMLCMPIKRDEGVEWLYDGLELVKFSVQLDLLTHGLFQSLTVPQALTMH